jgi:hypothetical protein
MFRDFRDRPFGSFILSESDPRQLALQLFSNSTAIAAADESDMSDCAMEPVEPVGVMETTLKSLQVEVQYVRRELSEIKNTIGYRLMTRLRQSRAFPVLHKIVRRVLKPTRRPPAASPRPARSWEFIEGCPKNSVVSICHPRWQGAKSAAAGHTPNLLVTPETGFPEIEEIADCLAASGATHFIADGFYAGYTGLLRLLRKRIPNAGIFYIHHGSFFQMLEDPSMPSVLGGIFRLQREGVIDRIGFCKAGMADAFRQLGIPAFEVMNRVPQQDLPPRREWKEPASVFIPVGAQLRKNPHTQLLGALLCPDVDEIHLTCDLDLRYLPPAVQKSVKLKIHRNLDRDATCRLMQESNVVLYATLSECAPMVPLESLALGVPCLTGDNHGQFDEYPALAKQLLISRADDPWAIATAISNVKRNYRECCREIQAFNQHYDRRAAQSLEDFLDLRCRNNEEVGYVRRIAG